MIIKSYKGEVNEDYSDTLDYLGTICIGQGDFIKCEKYFKRVLCIRKSITLQNPAKKDFLDVKIEQAYRSIGMICLLQGK